MTIKDFEKNLNSNITKLSEQLLNGQFIFSPTRAAIIAKDNGNYRPLQIPEVGDRAVLKSIEIALEKQLDKILSKSEGISFAYQKGKGVREAALQMKSAYQSGKKVILKADIINFFEEVQKDKLLKELVFPNLSDNSINHLIEKALSQKLGGLKRLNKKHWHLFENAGKGIPQGNPLSPLLSNLYLADFDEALKSKGYSLIRYADDFIVLFDSLEVASKGCEYIDDLLKDKFSLRIHPLDEVKGKTSIIDPTKSEFSFLSIKFDGVNIYPGKDTVGYLKSRIASVIKSGKLNKSLFLEIYSTIDKWIAIYSYLDIERYFESIDNFVLRQLKNKFGNQDYKPKKCRTLAKGRRWKQQNKGRSGFWGNVKIKKLLPNFSKKSGKVA